MARPLCDRVDLKQDGNAITLSLLFAGLRIPQWRNRSVPMAEFLLLMARGAHLSLTLARTQRPPQRSRCAGLQAPSSRSGSPTQLVRHATLAGNVVRLT